MAESKIDAHKTAKDYFDFHKNEEQKRIQQLKSQRKINIKLKQIESFPCPYKDNKLSLKKVFHLYKNEKTYSKTTKTHCSSAKAFLNNPLQNSEEKDRKTIDFQTHEYKLKQLVINRSKKQFAYFEIIYLAYFENLLIQITHKTKTAP
jgi:hypothetical protein